MLSVAVMAHPSRRAFVDWLLPHFPGAELVMDERDDRWDTGRRSLLAFDPAATHHLVIQDDALPCRDLIPAALEAARAAGDRPVGLYTGRLRIHQKTISPAVKSALALGTPWLEMPGPWWGVGIVLPTSHIPELVRWGDKHPQIRNYDRRIAAWYERQGIDCWYTVPSLVEHRPVGENPSLVKGRTGNRQAQCFLGNRSALSIDWSLPPARLRETVRFKHRHTGLVRKVEAGSSRERNMERNPRWMRCQKGAVAA